MKKGNKLGITIGSIVVAALVAVVLVLSFITTKPLENLADYNKAILNTSVVNNYQFSSSFSQEKRQNENQELKKLLGKSSYSVMQSILSGKVDTANEVYLEDGEEVTFGYDELKDDGRGLYSNSSYDRTLPRLRLIFSSVKTAKIGKEEYSFDSVEMLVANTNGEINEITCVAWDSTQFGLTDEENEDVKFVVFKISANTTELYNFLVNLEI